MIDIYQAFSFVDCPGCDEPLVLHHGPVRGGPEIWHRECYMNTLPRDVSDRMR